MKKRLIAKGLLGLWIIFLFACKKQIGSQKIEEIKGVSVSASLEDCGQLRTQSPGGWGAPPNGNNPGVYLHANFTNAFPNGLSVGCYPNNYYVRLTSAQAITDYLPAGGTPASIIKNYVDPATKELKNTLVMQVVALTLSTGFDKYDPNFGQAEVQLNDMIISSGVFKDWTVGAFLTEANKVLGGCGSIYTPQQINETADKINNNFDDGNTDNGFLLCPVIR